MKPETRNKHLLSIVRNNLGDVKAFTNGEVRAANLDLILSKVSESLTILTEVVSMLSEQVNSQE